jgi:crotonobetainyl-CoA:carnitine CoA-transferase CaiB-like acyl-CoA transferase
MARALEGIRVVDFSHVVAGPLATHFLALSGADVVKVEPPRGDALRNYTHKSEERGMAPAFAGINVDKRSIVLDLKTAEGRAAARALIDGADVVVENFRPGIMARFGLDYERVKAANPDLIYCSISGYGQSGPMRDFPAIDQIVQSVSGLMLMSGHPGEPAGRIGIPIVDTYVGLLAAFAIETALFGRSRHGGGQNIDLSMLDATLVMMAAVVNPYLIAGDIPARTGNRGFSGAPTADTFRTLSGEITIGAVEDAQVERLLGALGLVHLLEEPRFATRAARRANADAMGAELTRAFLDKPAAEWAALLNAANVPAGVVGSFVEALTLPQLAGRDLFIAVDGPDERSYRVLNAGFRFAADGPGGQRAAPRLGEHTEAILGELGADAGRERAAGE